jgi:PEP-CTERM motif
MNPEVAASGAAPRRGGGGLRLLLAGMVLATMASGAAQAQVADDDPLHLCYASGCTGFNGVTISVNSGQGFKDFGVSSSPASQTGTLWFALLIPNNENQITLPTVNGTLNGNPFGGGSLFANVGTFGAGQSLTSVLGGVFAGASPPNPFSAYAGATAALDSGFDHYTVYFAKIGGNNAFTTGSQAGQTITMNNDFTLAGGTFINPLGQTESGIGAGSILTAFMVETNKKGVLSVISTAQSSSLVNGGTLSVPEPSTWVMLLSGFGLMGAVGWKAKRKIKDRLAVY